MTGVLVREEAAGMATGQGAVSGETRPGNDEEILKKFSNPSSSWPVWWEAKETKETGFLLRLQECRGIIRCLGAWG